jgi:hypothetical protein
MGTTEANVYALIAERILMRDRNCGINRSQICDFIKEYMFTSEIMRRMKRDQHGVRRALGRARIHPRHVLKYGNKLVWARKDVDIFLRSLEQDAPEPGGR